MVAKVGRIAAIEKLYALEELTARILRLAKVPRSRMLVAPVSNKKRYSLPSTVTGTRNRRSQGINLTSLALGSTEKAKAAGTRRTTQREALRRRPTQSSQVRVSGANAIAVVNWFAVPDHYELL